MQINLINRLLLLLLAILLLLLPVFVYLTQLETQVSLKAAPQAELLLSPVSGNFQTGQSFNVFVRIDAKTHTLSGADVDIYYDSDKLSVRDADRDPTNGIQIQADTLFLTYLGNKTDPCGNTKNLRGKITLSGIAYSAALLPTPPPHQPFPQPGVQPVGTFATIGFDAIGPGTAQIQFNFQPNSTTDSNLLESSTAQDVLNSVTNGSFQITGNRTTQPPNCSATPTPTPTPTAGPSPTPSPSPTPIGGPACQQPDWDLDCDGLVCGRDASVLVTNWGKAPAYSCPASRPDCNPDFNHDNIINGADASVLMKNWSIGSCP